MTMSTIGWIGSGEVEKSTVVNTTARMVIQCDKNVIAVLAVKEGHAT